MQAGDRIRTGDLNLGKVALYQLSYTREASHRSELNRRLLDYESSALPLSYGGGGSGAGWSRTRDLMSAIHALSQLSYGPSKLCHGTTGLTGLEPATSGVTDRHSNQLSYSPRRDNTVQALRMGPTGLEPVTSTMST